MEDGADLCDLCKQGVSHGLCSAPGTVMLEQETTPNCCPQVESTLLTVMSLDDAHCTKLSKSLPAFPILYPKMCDDWITLTF